MYADTYPLPPIIARDTTEARKLSTQQEMSGFLAEVERRSFTYRSTLKTMPTRIEAATLGGDAGLFGAACLPLQDVRT